MVILNYRSTYLRRILSTNANKKKNDGILTHIKLPNILPEIFQIILRYIYGGRLSLEEYDNSDIVKILVTANNIKVWEHVLKWGIAQNPELPSDLSNYSKEDFNTLKDTLQQCIPFIKFYDLTSKEFLDKVYPYKKIIPKELRENLNKFYLNHDCKPITQKTTKEISTKCIDSRIITYQHAELISKWIDKLENVNKVYEFNLILRGSRDGFLPSKFHEICDNQPHTLTIIKVKDSDEILGGYNPIIWKSNGTHNNTQDSFIFSFKNKDNIGDHILSRVVNEMCAIYDDLYYGPTFDVDLVIYGNNFYDKSYCKKDSYDKPIRKSVDRFSVEEYEVFQIIKN
ncbi:carbohydrate-binding module family 13 protein [Rhizophagus clarus]|uniref:Carbohydrate-binding module family 13 protein n=1 Tax=Rhizophagus clarus TaxID=94130 RepID=A0A8H3MC25_9GLOM|nr:carbohydrate-binding module family 13 protein [Rhizophagus clarus]